MIAMTTFEAAIFALLILVVLLLLDNRRPS